jgi:putative transposase
VADICEFATDEGPLYLAALLDLCPRRIMGWSMSERRTAELVVDALAMGIADGQANRRPG